MCLGCGRKRSDPEMAEEELMNLLVQRIQGIREQVFTIQRMKLS